MSKQVIEELLSEHNGRMLRRDILRATGLSKKEFEECIKGSEVVVRLVYGGMGRPAAWVLANADTSVPAPDRTSDAAENVRDAISELDEAGEHLTTEALVEITHLSPLAVVLTMHQLGFRSVHLWQSEVEVWKLQEPEYLMAKPELQQIRGQQL